jgi:putative pyruvate formate lyase activating enzyme
MDYLSLLERCEICPRRCGVNRLKGEKGFCRVSNDVVVAYYGKHFGEEPPISGERGSGAIFFSSCNLRCVFCQNYQISNYMLGKTISLDDLVEIFFQMEKAGAHNINLVSPTPYIPHIAIAIRKAKEKGIKIPFVYNTNAYERSEILSLLEGLVDIYLPDFKYWNKEIAKKLSSANDYPKHAIDSILEMKRQVGSTLITESGIGKKGLIIRLLVLPNGLSGTKSVLRWIREEIGTSVSISLMSQYRPLFRAHEFPMIRRTLSEEEYDEVIRYASSLGFENVYVQEIDSSGMYLPDFTKEEPFKF